MNLSTFERAQVAAFAFREASHTGSLDCMKAVCYVLRNRIKAGWGDGSWLNILASHPHVAGNEPAEPREMKPSDRLLQLLVRDIDDIYLQQEYDDNLRRVVCGDDPPKTAALYYAFVNRPIRPWFAENIVRMNQDHPHSGNVGPIMLYR